VGGGNDGDGTALLAVLSANDAAGRPPTGHAGGASVVARLAALYNAPALAPLRRAAVDRGWDPLLWDAAAPLQAFASLGRVTDPPPPRQRRHAAKSPPTTAPPTADESDNATPA